MTYEQILRESLADYEIPEHMHDGVILYICRRIPPGDFLRALMSNDLREAYGRADMHNIRAMHQWVKWFYNEAPSPCWGSPENVAAWLAANDTTEAETAEIEKE